MIHVVFNHADVNVLQAAIQLDETLQGEIIEIKDDYAIGPILDIYTPEGRESRKQWWREVLAGGDYDGTVDKGLVQDEETVASLQTMMTEDLALETWIWAAQNKHDVSGYYWLMSQLKDFQGRIHILYLNNLPFINEKGHLFYPEWLHTIPPREFLKARKLSRPITLSEFEVDPDEWTRISRENKMVRILEGGKKLVQFDVDFFDADLARFIGDDWQKASRIIHQFQHKNRHSTGDAFLLWRLKHLLANGEYDIQGEPRNMKEFELKRKSVTPAETE